MYFRLNIASRAYLDRRSVQRWLLLVAGGLALLLAINLLYAWRNLQQSSLIDSRLEEIESKLVSRRDSASVAYTPEKFARVMGDIGTANKIITADQFRWSELFGKFEQLIPEDVAIRSLRPNYKERSLQIEAVARDTEEMTALLDALLESPNMNQVQLLRQSPKEQQDGESVVSFTFIIREAF